METEDQGVSEEQIEVVPDTEHDEEDAFQAETDEDKAEGLGIDVGELEEKDKVDPDETPEEKIEREAAEEAQAKLEADETPEEKAVREAEEKAKGETDEDILRGQELLDAEKEVADKEGAEKADVKPAAGAEGAELSPFEAAATVEDIEFLKSVMPENLLPKEAVTLTDGTELDFDYFQKENPEFLPAALIITKNIIDQMIANGALIGGADVDNQLFLRTVQNKVDGVPKANEIHGSEEFQKWLPVQPEAIQALLKSEDPYDHIRIFKRFLNKEGLDKAKGKVAGLDKKRAEKKKGFDAVHKSTVKSKKAARAAIASGADEEQEAFESDEDTDDFL